MKTLEKLKDAELKKKIESAKMALDRAHGLIKEKAQKKYLELKEELESRGGELVESKRGSDKGTKKYVAKSARQIKDEARILKKGFDDVFKKLGDLIGETVTNKQRTEILKILNFDKTGRHGKETKQNGQVDTKRGR